MQVLLSAMLIDTLHASLENAVVALNRVRIDLCACRFPPRTDPGFPLRTQWKSTLCASATIGVAPFLAAMINAVVLREMVA